jgi:translation elongation factor EF-Ts
MEEGFNEESLGTEFYDKAAESKNRFIREYFDFDGRLRNMKVDYLAKRLGKKGEDYVVELPEADFEEAKQIEEILADADFVEREQKMDELKWEKASDIARMDYFNMNAILAFMVKAKTVQRWAELDAAKGQEMFKKLVQEIRGTSANLDLSGGGKL